MRYTVSTMPSLWWRLRQGNLYRRAKYKLFPPPIWSPFLYSPKFLNPFRETLTREAAKANVVVEFGCLRGFSTVILAKATPGMVYSYDWFKQYPYEETFANIVAAGVGGKVRLRKADYHELLGTSFRFDLLYVDVHNTNEKIEEIYRYTLPFIRLGSVVLFEGATRLNPKVPFEVLVAAKPGLGRLRA